MNGIVHIDNAMLIVALRQVMNLNIFVLLVVLIGVDFITGTFKALKQKQMNSGIGIGGLLKHVTVILLVTIILIVGKVAQFKVLGYAFTIFYIFEYVVSIMENTHVLGVTYPDFIRNRLIQMREKFNHWGE